MKIADEEFDFPKWPMIALVAILVVWALNPIVIVGPGERGVVLTWGAVQDNIMGEGMNFRMPIAQDVKIMSVQTHKYSVTETAASKDLQDVKTEVALNYRLDAARVNKIYQTLGMDFDDRVISPAVQESVKAGTAQFTAEELITKRPEAKNAIDSALTTRLEPYGILVDTISITDFKFSDQFTAAIETKVTAEQNALAAKNKLEQIKYEAEQKVTTATAEATAIKIQGDALKDNPGVVSLRWIEKWSGTMPLVYSSGTGSGNMIFDMTSFVQQAVNGSK